LTPGKFGVPADLKAAELSSDNAVFWTYNMISAYNSAIINDELFFDDNMNLRSWMGFRTRINFP
jgi:hypothetical protein